MLKKRPSLNKAKNDKFSKTDRPGGLEKKLFKNQTQKKTVKMAWQPDSGILNSTKSNNKLTLENTLDFSRMQS